MSANDAPSNPVLNALRVSESRYRRLFETAYDGILLLNSETAQIEDVNPYLIKLLGYSHSEFLGRKLWEVGPFADRAESKEMFAELKAKGYVRYEYLPLKTKTGARVEVEFISNTYDCDGINVIQCNIRNITERKAMETKLARHTRLYTALSQCNKAIVHCTSAEGLFSQVCDAAVQFGGMKLAWIGITDTKTSMVRPAASFGDDTGYLKDLNISVDADTPFGQSPTGTAIRENHPTWCRDFLNDPATTAWHERAALAGLAASASLPLRMDGVVIGAFTLYSSEANPFDESARGLLIEMATDISFALDNLANESRRKQAEEQVRAAEGQFRGLVEQSIAGICIIQDGKFVYANPRLAEILGQSSAEELIGTDQLLGVVEADRGEMVMNMRRLLDGELQSVAYDYSIARTDVEVTRVGANFAHTTHEGRPAVIGMLQDISEKKHAEEQIQRHVKQLERAFMSTVEVVTNLSEMRDPYTAGHERRVAMIAVAISAELGFDEKRQEGLQVAGYLHDIGKISIPAEILSKPGKLSALEYQMIQLHPQAGYDVLKGVDFPWPVAQVAMQHHERMDGSGYPQGLKGEAILLEARILAVADVVEAMSSHRPYRSALGIESALGEILRGRETSYDPLVVDACMRLFREMGYTIPI